MTKKIILTISGLLLAVISLLAVPAKRGVIEVEQPDGTTLSIILTGDEWFNYATTADGYLLTNGANGQWEYAKWENNEVVSLGVKAQNEMARTALDRATIAKVGKFTLKAEEANALRAKQRQMVSPRTVGEGPNPVPRAIVILVNFSDVSFRSMNTPDKFTNKLNQDNYNGVGSAKNYFEDASYGKYSPDFDVFGPYTLDNNRAYYGGGRPDARPYQMVVDAYTKLVNDKSVNIDLSDYDSDGDTHIDNIFIYYAGNNEAEGGSQDCIWPHKSQLFFNGELRPGVDGLVTQKGYTVDRYACTSELKGSSSVGEMCGIGTFCHEFTHVLGLPDVYDTDNHHGWKTSGDWDIMDAGAYNGGGHVPAGYTAYERFYMDWVKPTVLNSAGDYELAVSSSSDSAAYIISYSGAHNMNGAFPNPQVFYLLENRLLEGWDAHIPGKGMVATRINFDKSVWQANSPNNDKTNLRIDIIEADGINNHDYSHSGKPGDAFPCIPGVNGVPDYYDETITEFIPYETYPVTDITFTNDTIRFKFMGGTPAYTVKFNAGDHGTCSTAELSESAPLEGVMLPDVTANSPYEFEGWSTLRSANVVDAGEANELYHPHSNMTLYSVYSLNGEIVEGNGGCFTETFNGLIEDGSQNVSSRIDDLADNKGWKANAIYCVNGAAQIGSSSAKGEITTPALGFDGGGSVVINVKGEKRTYMHVTVVGGGTLSTSKFTLTTSYKDIAFDINGATEATQLKIKTDANIFYIDSIEVCQKVSTSNDMVFGENLMVVDNSYISGLATGDIISCIDMNGRMLWREASEGDMMYFTAPEGVYLITVMRDGHVTSIKNVNF